MKSLIIGILEILFSLILGVAFAFGISLYTLIGFFIAALITAILFVFVHQISKISEDILLFIFGGFIVGMIIGSIIFASFANINQYPISMQVFYPNHPNITITPNCTAFSNSASGYLNGQPINPQNTTECNLPENMTKNVTVNPFNCNITGKNITCIGEENGISISEEENVTWKGTILNVSKR